MPIPWYPQPEFIDQLNPEFLNDWYEQRVGYRPQEDDPNMTDAELRKLVKSYIEEMIAEG